MAVLKIKYKMFTLRYPLDDLAQILIMAVEKQWK